MQIGQKIQKVILGKVCRDPSIPFQQQLCLQRRKMAKTEISTVHSKPCLGMINMKFAQKNKRNATRWWARGTEEMESSLYALYIRVYRQWDLHLLPCHRIWIPSWALPHVLMLLLLAPAKWRPWLAWHHGGHALLMGIGFSIGWAGWRQDVHLDRSLFGSVRRGNSTFANFPSCSKGFGWDAWCAHVLI